MDFRNVRLPIRVGLPFAALAIGFFGAVVYVPLALQPLTGRAEVIQHELAESVRLLSDARSQTRDLRMDALLAYQAERDRTIARAGMPEPVADGAGRLRAYLDEYARLPRGPDEDAIWRRVRDAELPAFDAAVARTLAARTRPGGDPAAIRALAEAGMTLDEGLRRLVQINIDATQVETAENHSDMRRLSIAYVVLAALGALGALLLVPQIVRVLRSYQASVTSRVAELEAFAGQISHDLRTPLQTVQLAIHNIEKVADDPPRVRRLAARATSAVHRLDGMIQDLLQFARSGAEAREDGRSDVREVVGELARELAAQAERAHVALTTRADAVTARIPPVALETVLANLVENAIKYRKPAGENRVAVTAEANGDEVELRVEDTGVGIAPDALPHVFEPFFRGTQRPDSYGLGLATVKRLVEAHRGTISVRSEEGRGSTFVVRLPRAPGERPPRSPVGAPGRAGEPEPRAT